MKNIFKTVTLIIFTYALFAYASCSKNDDSAISTPNSILKADIKSTRDAFVTKVNSLGFRTQNIPIIRIENTPAIITYGPEGLTVPEWTTLGSEQKNLFNSWADQATGTFTGEQYFKKSFNWFLVIHELGHYIQDVKGTINSLSSYQSEMQANQIAVAYWKVENRQALDEYMVWVNAILEIIPDPEDTSEAYYNANIEAETANNNFNGYFQFYFIQQAYVNIDNLELVNFL